MRAQFKNPNFYFMLLADAAGIALSVWLAYALRFDLFQSGDYTFDFRSQILPSVLCFVPFKLAVFYAFGLYRGMWRYTNLHDMRKIAAAVIAATLAITAFIGYRFHFQGFSRGIYLLDAVFTFAFAAGLRLTVRELFAVRENRRLVNPFQWGSGGAVRRRKTRALVVGAGFCGEHLFRQLTADRAAQYEVVCYLDDDPKKQQRSLHGIRIAGGIEKMEAAIEHYQADLVLIAISAISGDRLRRIVEACESAGIPFKRVPSAGSIVNGQVSLKELRDVNYEDLLGRLPVTLDNDLIQSCLGKKTVLVSGAGGSIGSELCRQIALFNPGRIVLIEHSEYNLFAIEAELKNGCASGTVIPVLGAIQDASLMDAVFSEYNPSIVFHAAAYKHVPMLEINPWEAVNNNIIGSYVLMQTAVKHGAERFVVVSTDKAVRPTNVMGASKRVTELLMQGLNGNGTRFMSVRFGNVVGSSGSVVPFFRQQIMRGGPVTVTHPEATRYFMTIPEAAQLILQAGALGDGGEIFVLRMGTPVKIADMARDLIRLSGKEPDAEIEIQFTGLRPGEKLYEELMHDDENIIPTRYDEIMMLRNNDMELARRLLDGGVAELQKIAGTRNAAAIKTALQHFVPEYNIQEAATVL